MYPDCPLIVPDWLFFSGNLFFGVLPFRVFAWWEDFEKKWVLTKTCFPQGSEQGILILAMLLAKKVLVDNNSLYDLQTWFDRELPALARIQELEFQRSVEFAQLLKAIRL